MATNISLARLALEQVWSVRQCFICDRLGACPHREADADLAWYEAQSRRLAEASFVGVASTKGNEQNVSLRLSEENEHVH